MLLFADFTLAIESVVLKTLYQYDKITEYLYFIREENIMATREKFSSRLGFILVSAGCAIGIGNVWKFPYITGMYGGAGFILMYLAFLQAKGYRCAGFDFLCFVYSENVYTFSVGT